MVVRIISSRYLNAKRPGIEAFAWNWTRKKESYSGVSLFISLLILDSELKLRHSQFALINTTARALANMQDEVSKDPGKLNPWKASHPCMDPNSLWLVSGYLIVIHAWRYKSSS